MIVGVDFDNTLVCYDTIFWKIARERGLIPASVPVVKDEVRNYLRAQGAEDAWTELQGVVYGERITEAEAFPGALEFFAWASNRNVELSIVSHKTATPIIGAKTDLHAAARRWLAANNLGAQNAYFEVTREKKLSRIAALRCAAFLDDLIEVLEEPTFPVATRKILFDPGAKYSGESLQRVVSWGEFQKYISEY